VASQDEGALHVSWPGIVVLLVTAWGLILAYRSLESPRPTSAAVEGKPASAGSSVPARLWQDPLATAQRGQQLEGDIASLVDRRPQPNGADQKNPKVLFLFDCIDPENNPEAAEMRRRERYAILSALNTAGYVPTDPGIPHEKWTQG
jgi:hypothetical protein